jgi:hypothetical protein
MLLLYRKKVKLPPYKLDLDRRTFDGSLAMNLRKPD